MNYYDEKYNELFLDLFKKYCTRKLDILPKDAMIALINRFVDQIKKEPIEINLEPDGNPLVHTDCWNSLKWERSNSQLLIQGFP